MMNILLATFERVGSLFLGYLAGRERSLMIFSFITMVLYPIALIGDTVVLGYTFALSLVANTIVIFLFNIGFLSGICSKRKSYLTSFERWLVNHAKHRRN